MKRELTRDFQHDEIRLDVAAEQYLYVSDFYYTGGPAVPVPAMPTWSILLLAGLMGLGATPAVRRRFNV